MDHRVAELLQMLIGLGAGVVALIAILKYKLRLKAMDKGSAHISRN